MGKVTCERCPSLSGCKITALPWKVMISFSREVSLYTSTEEQHLNNRQHFHHGSRERLWLSSDCHTAVGHVSTVLVWTLCANVQLFLVYSLHAPRSSLQGGSEISLWSLLLIHFLQYLIHCSFSAVNPDVLYTDPKTMLHPWILKGLKLVKMLCLRIIQREQSHCWEVVSTPDHCILDTA